MLMEPYIFALNLNYICTYTQLYVIPTHLSMPAYFLQEFFLLRLMCKFVFSECRQPKDILLSILTLVTSPPPILSQSSRRSSEQSQLWIKRPDDQGQPQLHSLSSSPPIRKYVLIESALGTAFLKEEPPKELPLREILLIK